MASRCSNRILGVGAGAGREVSAKHKTTPRDVGLEENMGNWA